MQIGYKGFNNKLQGHNSFQFEIGGTYIKPEKDNINVCSSDGFHFCRTLREVFHHFSNNGYNRFCEVEILGKTAHKDDKSITTSLRIIKEITKEELDQIIIEDNLNLDIVRSIQTKHPQFHVGGSVGLFLHGVRLNKWKKNTSDIDMVSPYFIRPDDKIDDYEVTFIDAKASANDFDVTFLIDDTKVDYRIDPKQRYELITYKGYTYKVSPIMTILEAKMRYALTSFGSKHKEDLLEMVGVTKHKQDKAAQGNVLLRIEADDTLF